jgi:MFS family permease
VQYFDEAQPCDSSGEKPGRAGSPTLGGWITDNYDWRWIFFINIPIAILSLFLTHRLVEDTPKIKKEVEEAKRGGFRLDLIGFGLVALTFGSLEVVLDKGQEDDWFGSIPIFWGPTGVQNSANLSVFRGSQCYKGNQINGT